MNNDKVNNNNNPFDEYLSQLNLKDNERKNFADYFDKLKKEFFVFCKSLFDKETSNNHNYIISMLAVYLKLHTKIEKAEEIKIVMIDKVFFDWFNLNSVHHKINKKQLKETLRIFFNFLEG